MRPGGFAFLVLLTACTRTTSAPDAPSKGAPTAPPSTLAGGPSATTSAPAPAISAPPAASATAAPVQYPPVFPLPKTPAGADSEKVRFVSALCPAAVMHPKIGNKAALLVGCRVHPPYDAPERWPDGTLPEHTGDPLRFCALNAIYKGSFTRAGAKQAVLAFDQCKESDDNWDMGNPGSAVLVEEIDGHFREIDWQPGVNGGECKPAKRRDGHDVLFCLSGFGAAGLGEMDYLFDLDFARSRAHAGTFVWLFADMLAVGCMDLGARGFQLAAGLVSLKPPRFSVTDLDKDGNPDVVVDVERARIGPSPALDAKAAALCNKNPTANVGAALLPPATKTRLEFMGSSDAVAPTATAKATLDAWEGETPDLLQLRRAAPPKLEVTP